MRSIVTCGLFLLLVFSPAIAAPDATKGQILEKVVCEADSTQTYALYVPSSYTAEKLWPVIYCFDPGARGKTPVERLLAAAEEYGYILAGSNNSRNGAWEANEAAIQAMTRDVAAHFSIDRRRIYTAGLSGGSRVAIQVAMTGYAKGVIACSAGFTEPVPIRVPFPIFGTAGLEDFNYREMKQLDVDLEARAAAHRIVIFDGGHEWAPATLLAQAVEWLELQAMRMGTRDRNEKMLNALWETRVAAVPPRAGLERWRELKSLAVDFKGLRDTGDAEAEEKRLGSTAEVKDAIKAERALIAREVALLEKLVGTANRSAATKQKLATEVRGKAEAAEDSPERRMALRVLASYFYMVREDVRGFFTSRDYVSAADMLELAVLLRPGQSRTWFDLARARGYSRDPQRAYEPLRQAVTAGFSDAARAETEPAFAKIKAEPAFQTILAAMRANPPEAERRPGEGRGRFP
ncbi:MAG: hypothetical protein ABIO94_11830 [Opitutaceae bacterium]